MGEVMAMGIVIDKLDPIIKMMLNVTGVMAGGITVMNVPSTEMGHWI